MKPVKLSALPTVMPGPGIYLFSEGKRHLYVGRAKNVKERLRLHCRPSSSHYSATFAFRLARKATGKLKASYTRAGSRAKLLGDKELSKAFDRAKERIRQMDIRFVAEADPLKQTLLEIYAAVALKTPYNDFETH